MSGDCKAFCSACTRQHLKCNRGKPRCENCLERGTKCRYFFKLRWGGRQYKDQNKQPKIPNTKFYRGALLLKDKSLIVGNKAQTVTHFMPFDDEAITLKPLQYGKKSVEEVKDELPLDCSEMQIIVKDQIQKAPQVKWFMSDFSYPAKTFTEFGQNAWEFSSLFDLFVNETSQFFVGLNSKTCPNPFRTILPQMALSCPTLLKLLVVFGAKHRKMISFFEEETKFQSLEDGNLPISNFELIGENLLSQALVEVTEKSHCPSDSFDDCTIATALVLSTLSIFSCDGEGAWRIHHNGAKRIAFRGLKVNENLDHPVIHYRRDPNPHFFLLRWFIYLDVIGLLSSASFASKAEETFRPQVDFSSEYDVSLNKSMMEKLEDINPLSGMDVNVFAYLTKVSQLILQKRYAETNEDYYKTISEAVKLDYQISNYLQASELERDQNLNKYKISRNLPLNSGLSDYELMRSSNLIIGLTGILQLRRRIVEMSQDSQLVKDLVLQITELIVEKVPKYSSILSSISFCLFVVGCELVDSKMEVYREAYLDRLKSLWKRGLKNVSQAVKVMEESWRSRKPWWVILEEENLDICFAL